LIQEDIEKVQLKTDLEPNTQSGETALLGDLQTDHAEGEIKVESVLKKPCIAHLQDSNTWLVYNHFIHSGYRTNYDNWECTIKSILECHNETINVWTHFSGFWIAFALIWFVQMSVFSQVYY
jgi:hypothetical protein